MAKLQIRCQLVAAITAACCVAAPVTACQLQPMSEQVLLPNLRSETPAYAELNYRKQVFRYVNGYFRQIASDIMRGEGEYLDSLHSMMGSLDSDCTPAYKTMLLDSNSAQSFARSLWAFRTEEHAANEAAETAD